METKKYERRDRVFANPFLNCPDSVSKIILEKKTVTKHKLRAKLQVIFQFMIKHTFSDDIALRNRATDTRGPLPLPDTLMSPPFPHR